MKTPVCAVLDIGKTNKKVFLFDENYRIVLEKSGQFPETTDEDGDPCENVDLLTDWVIQSLQEVLSLEEYDVKAINFSTYGASFLVGAVHRHGQQALFLRPQRSRQRDDQAGRHHADRL